MFAVRTRTQIIRTADRQNLNSPPPPAAQATLKRQLDRTHVEELKRTNERAEAEAAARKEARKAAAHLAAQLNQKKAECAIHEVRHLPHAWVLRRERCAESSSAFSGGVAEDGGGGGGGGDSAHGGVDAVAG